MDDARLAQGSVPAADGKGKEPERSSPEPPAISPLQAALMAVCGKLTEASDGRIGTSTLLDKMHAPEVLERRKAAEASNDGSPESLAKKIGLVPNIPTIIDSLQKKKIDQDEEMQILVAAEKALQDEGASSSKGTQPYKRRRIVSSELMSNTKYYMAKTPDVLHPALGELSLSTRSFKRRVTPTTVGNRRFDLISSLSSFNILTAEIVKYLHPREVLTLYSISRVFHATWNASELSFARIMASFVDPAAAVAFPWEIYRDYLIRNPKGYIDIDYTQPSWTRGRDIDKPEEWEKVSSCRGVSLDTQNSSAADPGLETAVPAKSGSRFCAGMAWVNMLAQRERQSRDILAIMARRGHRVPPDTRWVLRKLWLLLDCSTNDDRARLMATWSDLDLFLAEIFFIKLGMIFTDPISGDGSTELTDLMLGQPTGLRCLWQLLRRKRFRTDVMEILRLQLMFEHEVTQSEARGKTIMGIPVALVGIVHTEGWGHGDRHLMQPAELVAIESLRRDLALETKTAEMMSWGRRDHDSGLQLVPKIEEIYMSDDELGPAPAGIDGRAGNVPLEANDWMPHHCMRAVFDTLSPDEQLAVIAVEEDELLKAQAWLPEDDLSDGDDEDDDDIYGNVMDGFGGNGDGVEDDGDDVEDDGDDVEDNMDDLEDDGDDVEDNMDDLEDDGDDEYDSDEDDDDWDDDNGGDGAANPNIQGPPAPAPAGSGLLQSTMVSFTTQFVTLPAPNVGPVASSNNNTNLNSAPQHSGPQNQAAGDAQPSPGPDQFFVSFQSGGNPGGGGGGTVTAAPHGGTAGSQGLLGQDDSGWVHGPETAEFGIRSQDGAYLVPRGAPSTRLRYHQPGPALCMSKEAQSPGAPPCAGMSIREAVDWHLNDYSRVIEQWQARHGNAQAIVARAAAAAATEPSAASPRRMGVAFQGHNSAGTPLNTYASSTMIPAAPNGGPNLAASTGRPNDHQTEPQEASSPQEVAMADPSTTPQQGEDYDPAAGLPDNMDMNIFAVAVDAYHENAKSTDLGLDNKLAAAAATTATPLLSLVEGMEHASGAGACVGKTPDPHAQPQEQQHGKEPSSSLSTNELYDPWPTDDDGGDDDDGDDDDDDGTSSSDDDDDAVSDGGGGPGKKPKPKKKKRRNLQALGRIVRQREPRVEVLDHVGRKWNFKHSGSDSDVEHRHVYEELDPEQTPYEYRQY
ncbi:hypothetical protein RB594_002379 [Gaeumannomyces avenae]